MRTSRYAALLTSMALLLMLGGVALYSFLSLRRAMTRLDLIVREVLSANEASEESDRLLHHVSDAIVARDEASRDKMMRSVSAIQAQIEILGEEAQAPEVGHRLESLRRMAITCGEQSQHIFHLALTNRIPEAVIEKAALERTTRFMKEDISNVVSGELMHYRGLRAELSDRAARMAVLIVTATGAILLASFLLLGFAFRDELRKRERLNVELEARVRARSQELEATQRQLVEAAHLAGRAEVSASVLHNVGNVLNSLNINANLSAEALKHLALNRIARTGELIEQHRDEPGWLRDDPRGKMVPEFLGRLGRELERERERLIAQQHEMIEHVEHIKQVIATQNAFASRQRLVEQLPLTEIIELALRINHGALQRHAVDVVRRFDKLPEVRVEKHKVLQILVNLISNAQRALVEGRETGRRMIVHLGWGGPGRWRIEVEDNGIGIATENLNKLFHFGFTTRKDGHGIGLHSCALAAQEMGGTLIARSEGPGQGALFQLEVPMEEA
ncbi:sensor histidine kinase [Hyalangium versicolor]|uniref:sensor histidine kinase n=1 Tax=Hyalangium versicolor TaxID=2861190 RepID=UPI001CCC3AB0|nr:ATP-binding protein [Hyalangium versicolor]